MEIQVLQFDERVGLGTFQPWLEQQQCGVRSWRCDQLQFPGSADHGPVLLLGGYMGVEQRQNRPYLQAAIDWVGAEVETGRPILAICLGGQLLAHALGGEVHSHKNQEKGIAAVSLTAVGQADPLFRGLPDPFVSFEWHNDSFDLPAGSVHLAQTAACPGQAFRRRNAWGIQFHPEVDELIVADWCRRTKAGEEPLETFRQWQDDYFAHSKQLLQNFVAVAARLTGEH